MSEQTIGRSGPNEPDSTPESIGARLTRLRLARGYSQLRVAELLCAAAGTPTVSRHEVSRWEREERVPGGFWLGWLAMVLDTPLDQLEWAVAATRRLDAAAARGRAGDHLLWRPPAAAELLNDLDHAGGRDIRELAHAWLAGPPEPAAAHRSAGSPARGRDDHPRPESLDAAAARLRTLRRTDDLIGGLDLAHHIDRELRSAIATLRLVGGRGQHRRALRIVAGLAQLAGWVHVDAGDPARGRRAYRVGLRAATAAADRPLAAHVLGALSHQSLAAGDRQEALLLARTGHAGARRSGSALIQALLLHRVALAAARAGERRAAQAALAAAERVSDRAASGREPDWLYWLDETELAAMTGRCLAALGRPLRAAHLLTTERPGAGPRTAALYAGWLARVCLDLGEVEQACQVAATALPDVVRAGSARAATGLHHLHPLLLRHRDVPAVRGYERLVAAAATFLPSRGGVAPPRRAAGR